MLALLIIWSGSWVQIWFYNWRYEIIHNKQIHRFISNTATNLTSLETIYFFSWTPVSLRERNIRSEENISLTTFATTQLSIGINFKKSYQQSVSQHKEPRSSNMLEHIAAGTLWQQNNPITRGWTTLTLNYYSQPLYQCTSVEFCSFQSSIQFTFWLPIGNCLKTIWKENFTVRLCIHFTFITLLFVSGLQNSIALSTINWKVAHIV